MLYFIARRNTVLDEAAVFLVKITAASKIGNFIANYNDKMAKPFKQTYIRQTVTCVYVGEIENIADLPKPIFLKTRFVNI